MPLTRHITGDLLEIFPEWDWDRGMIPAPDRAPDPAAPLTYRGATLMQTDMPGGWWTWTHDATDGHGGARSLPRAFADIDRHLAGVARRMAMTPVTVQHQMSLAEWDAVTAWAADILTKEPSND